MAYFGLCRCLKQPSPANFVTKSLDCAIFGYPTVNDRHLLGSRISGCLEKNVQYMCNSDASSNIDMGEMCFSAVRCVFR